MVLQHGRSGAEKDLIFLAQKSGFSIESLNEIDLLLKDITTQYQGQRSGLFEQIRLQIGSLHTKIETTEENLKLERVRVVRDIEAECKELEMEIARLELIRFELRQLPGYISGKFKLHRARKRLSYLDKDTDAEVNIRLENTLLALESLRNQLNYLEDNTDMEVERRLSDLEERLKGLQGLKQTNEYKGALGELSVIKNLSKLCDEYYLFNDLQLELDDYVQFDGSSLRSAQIDHLVAGPTGVFVIETKNWSSKYIQSVFADGSYTPYEQIRRSSYLAYRYLNRNKYGNALKRIHYSLAEDEVKVGSILAITGSSIPFKKQRFTKVLSHNVVASHIMKADRVLSTESVEQIADSLRDV